MGACLTSSDATSRMIDAKMKENEASEKTYHKLLFLGPGGGGKSTIFKQLQWLHGGGFTTCDLQILKHYVCTQVINQMQAAIKHYLSSSTEDTELQNKIDFVDAVDITFEYKDSWSDISESISFIWKKDVRLRGLFEKYDEQHIIWQSTEYFWDALPRISAPDYIPTKLDIMKVRNMTTGVVQKRFAIESCNFHIFDVGGQKSERKKWITCFNDVSVIVFVASLSSYNELMFEDKTTNCMLDATELFDTTINNPQFADLPVILFLNKTDLFRRKIKKIAITACPLFKDFDENAVYEATQNMDAESNKFHQSATFIRNKFQEKSKSIKRCIYTHFTCAMDDANIQHVFDDIVNVMMGKMNKALLSSHLL